jgi:NAD(P)H-dependent FMN reductase
VTGPVRLLTVSGSLRIGSSNSALLDAAARSAPPHVVVTRFDGLEALPAFNPDIEMSGAPLPLAVQVWQRALTDAQAVLVSSPEYAHGIPGVLKNALDWVVGSGELVNKPTGLLSASSASQFVHPQLLEVLTVMSARMVPGATRVLDILRRGVTVELLLADDTLAGALREVMQHLAGAAQDAAS